MGAPNDNSGPDDGKCPRGRGPCCMSLPGRRGNGTLPDARSRSRAMCPTHERTTRWQVSWLADRRFLAAFPEKSPVACGPQAPGLQLRVQPRNCTEFPLGSPTGKHHLRALSENGQACVNSPCLVVGRVCMRTSRSGVAGRRAGHGWSLATRKGSATCCGQRVRPQQWIGRLQDLALSCAL